MREMVFHREASCWEEALPIGNGRLGAMFYGGVRKERLQLNEDSIWYGKAVNRINPDAKKNLGKVRSLILGGRPDEAQKLLKYAFSGTPQSQRIYQPLADCDIWMYHKGNPLCESNSDKVEQKVYKRTLQLGNAVGSVSYQTECGRIDREYFASAVHGVIVVRMEASGREKISFDLLLTREHFYDSMLMDKDDTVYLTGNLGKGGLDFAAGCKIKVENGEVSRIGEHLLVRAADKVTIFLAGTSTFYEKFPIETLEKTLTAASELSYEDLKKAHVEDYQALFNRVTLVLPEDEACSGLTTDQRLARVKQGKEDVGLAAVYFDFGRYLLLSCSRPGGMPANLQGLWNHRMMPPWESKYTININTEMNYWPAESCGMQECMEPLFDLLERMSVKGKRTAKEMYGCRGFMAHHNTDLWADTAPQDHYIPATYWTLGGAWLSLYIWRHYEYNQDKQWLEKYFPILEEAVVFFLDFLIEDHGEYVTCPSVSPENTYIMQNGVHACVCAGPAMDNEILRDLFDAYTEASELLGKDRVIREKVKKYREKLPPIQIGKHGQIMEWREDYDEEEPGHRHISQLYALYPSSQITLDGTPDLAKAAEATLARRMHYGSGHTGWSCAWIANLYAQLGQGDKAWKMLHHLFRNSTFDNLMDNHPMIGGPVFQIDGNLGACDAIIQMLVQDNGRRVLLLPACPEEWTAGELSGLRLKGNAELEIKWNQEEVCGTITAGTDWRGRVVCCKQVKALVLKQGESMTFRFKK